MLRAHCKNLSVSGDLYPTLLGSTSAGCWAVHYWERSHLLGSTVKALALATICLTRNLSIPIGWRYGRWTGIRENCWISCMSRSSISTTSAHKIPTYFVGMNLRFILFLYNILLGGGGERVGSLAEILEGTRTENVGSLG